VRNLCCVVVAGVCLGITGPRVAWAEPAQVDWVEDPDAPHVTRGTTARLGTAVGFVYGQPIDVLALGLTAAVGQRYDRLTIEAELDTLKLQQNGGANTRLGDAERLGVVARFDILRLGSRWVGGNSLLSIYVEGGAAVAWNHWYQPGADEPMRDVPADTKRVEGQAGLGISLDHRLQEPIGFPRRIGWFLGWRVALAPRTAETALVCRGATCRTAQTMPEDRLVDRSMLFQSSLAMTW
jgi:hypothetical protein